MRVDLILSTGKDNSKSVNNHIDDYFHTEGSIYYQKCQPTSKHELRNMLITSYKKLGMKTQLANNRPKS
jgi:hypothetical protein